MTRFHTAIADRSLPLTRAHPVLNDDGYIRMQILDTPIPDLKVIEPRVFGDERGFFMESRKDAALREHGINVDFVQDNHSKSSKGVLRGLHFQTRKPQTKLVRVTAGAAYDVAVDCRVGSPTYGQRYGLILSAANHKQLLVPKGFAHGFLSLEEGTEFLYKVDDVYDAGGEGGLMRDDPEIGIDRAPVMSEYGIQQVQVNTKDSEYQGFEVLPEYFEYMSKGYKKEFDVRNTRKKKINRTLLEGKYPKPREVRNLYVGTNIGSEADGKRKSLRPVLVIQKLGSTYLCVPMTTKGKLNSPYYYHIKSVDFFDNRGEKLPSALMLSHIKTYDSKRFYKIKQRLSQEEFDQIKKLLGEVVVGGFDYSAFSPDKSRGGVDN